MKQGHEFQLPRSVAAVSFPEQDENGVDLSLIIENLRLTPSQRLLKADQARRSALRLNEYGRRNREKRS
jgi:hypothetical protein